MFILGLDFCNLIAFYEKPSLGKYNIRGYFNILIALCIIISHNKHSWLINSYK